MSAGAVTAVGMPTQVPAALLGAPVKMLADEPLLANEPARPQGEEAARCESESSSQPHGEQMSHSNGDARARTLADELDRVLQPGAAAMAHPAAAAAALRSVLGGESLTANEARAAISSGLITVGNIAVRVARSLRAGSARW